MKSQDEDPSLSAALAAAKTALEARTSGSVAFGPVERLDSQHTVLRAALREGAGLPGSVVVKQVPPEARFGARNRALSEWAGLEFAGAIAGPQDFAPRFLGGDAEQLLVILEDLGEAQSLDQVLHQADRATGLRTLREYGAFLGNFHGAAFGREPEFRSIQERLGVEAPLNDSSVDFRDRLDQFRSAFAPLTDHMDALESEVLAASAAMHDPHPFRTFQHHDAGPHNVLVTSRGLRFVDFEFARYDNALLDMTALRLAFPPFGKGHLLPADAAAAFETAYRQAASAAIPEMADEALYQLTLEQACVQWVVSKAAGLGESLHPVLVRNDLGESPDPGRAERVAAHRKLLFTWITAYLGWFGDRARLPYTRDAVRRLAVEIERWNPGVEAAGIYGAFAP